MQFVAISMGGSSQVMLLSKPW